MDHLNFFSHQRISDRLYVLTEGYSMVHRFTIGLVLGDEKNLVIDAGLGMTPGLRDYIEKLAGSDKPLICAATHLHPDHVGSAMLFDEVFCSHRDFPARADFAFSGPQRLEDLVDFAIDSGEVMEYCSRNYLRDNFVDCRDIRDGNIFDLGGVQIRAIALPGHSDGSMIFYNREENYAFTGDAVNTDVHLKKLDRQGFAEYAEHLRRFLSIVGEEVTLYPCHLPLAMDVSVVKNLIKVCEDLVAGNTDGDPPGETIFKARNNDPNMRMHYVGNSCIVYNAALVGTGNTEQPPKFLNFYSHEQVGDRTYVVTENYSMVHRFTIGVIVGDEKVLVIDSGMGMDSDLRRYIERFTGTGKPMLCACTHGAIDHAGAACLFDEVFLNQLDEEMLPRAFLTERRLSDLDAFSLHNQEVIAYGKAHMIDNRGTKFTWIDEDYRFDLGGVTVRPIHTPGHSRGHLAYFCPEENIAFVGDAINADIHIKALDRQGLLAYREMLNRFVAIVGEETRLYAGHLNRAQPVALAKNLATACEEVANGQTQGDPPGETIFMQNSGNTSTRMHYHGNSCIIYDASLL